MVYTISIIIISLLIFIAWFWRYRIKPYYAKNELDEYFNNHSDGQRLKNANQLLRSIYANLDPYRISKRERKRLAIHEDAFIYGEIDFLAFFTILEKTNPKQHEIFYDLGSGSGKAVFAAAFYSNLSKSCGIELLPALHSEANMRIYQAYDLDSSKIYEKNILSIQFINDNFLNVDISDGDIIFINATCLSYPTWESILNKIKKLKSGSRVIVTTKKIQDEQFNILFQGIILMSWGMNSINIYEKN